MTILHGLFRRSLPRLRALLPLEVSRRARLSQALGFDLNDSETLPALLLTLVLSAEPNSMVLVSTTTPARVTGTVKGVDWAAVRGERADFIVARDALITALAEADDV